MEQNKPETTEGLVAKLSGIRDELRFLFELSFNYDEWERNEIKNKKAKQ